MNSKELALTLPTLLLFSGHFSFAGNPRLQALCGAVNPILSALSVSPYPLVELYPGNARANSIPMIPLHR